MEKGTGVFVDCTLDDLVDNPHTDGLFLHAAGFIRNIFSTLPLFMLDTSGFDGSIVPKTGISMEKISSK